MKNVKRKFTSEFKLKVILDALTERNTLSELSQKYELHPNQISLWKSDFLLKAKQILEVKKEKPPQQEHDVNELFTKIGKLQIELDFLKKKLS
jgi:transposase